MARDSVFSYYVTATIEKWRPCCSRYPQLMYQAQLNIFIETARYKFQFIVTTIIIIIIIIYYIGVALL